MLIYKFSKKNNKINIYIIYFNIIIYLLKKLYFCLKFKNKIYY